MNTDKTLGSLRGLSVGALVFGILGAALYWWVPMGMVFGLAGLLLGFFDGTIARRRSLDYRLSIVAVILSVAALALDVTIALLGMQTITFGSR